MSTPSQPSPSPRVRDLTRWGLPLHYAPPLIVAAIGIAMLLVGGVVGGFGGWLLAVALPIAIGAFLRSPWFALVPVAVWTGWLIYAGGVGLGAGATLLAQRAVFPATEPEAWRASMGRLVPPLDDGATTPLADELDEHALDAEVAAGLQVTDAELAEAQRAAEPAVESTDEADEADEADADDKVETSADDDEAEPSADEADDEVEPSAADDEVEASADDDADDAEARNDASEADADDAPVAAPATASADRAEPDGATDSGDAHVELPVDADPSPLDEGGHVTEFAAISEADLDADADDDADDDDDDDAQAEPAHADSEAASR